MDDIRRNGLSDVVRDAIAHSDYGFQYQAHGITKKVFLADLAVLKDGILRVSKRYRIANFDARTSDDPMVLQQNAEDLNTKKGLCYNYLHTKYRNEYDKRCDSARVLGYEIDNSLKDWYNGLLEDLCKRFINLGYV